MRQTSAHSAAVTGCTERRVGDEAHLGELGVGLGVDERDGLRQVADRLDIDALPGAGGVVGIGMGQRDHADDADDLLALVGMVEEARGRRAASPACCCARDSCARPSTARPCRPRALHISHENTSGSDLSSQYIGSPSRRDGVALAETGDVFVFFAISASYPMKPTLNLTYSVSSRVTDPV